MPVTVLGKTTGNLMMLSLPTAVFHPRKEASPPLFLESRVLIVTITQMVL
jgi:hypothetical protein